MDVSLDKREPNETLNAFPGEVTLFVADPALVCHPGFARLIAGQQTPKLYVTADARRTLKVLKSAGCKEAVEAERQLEEAKAQGRVEFLDADSFQLYLEHVSKLQPVVALTCSEELVKALEAQEGARPAWTRGRLKVELKRPEAAGAASQPAASAAPTERVRLLDKAATKAGEEHAVARGAGNPVARFAVRWCLVCLKGVLEMLVPVLLAAIGVLLAVCVHSGLKLQSAGQMAGLLKSLWATGFKISFESTSLDIAFPWLAFWGALPFACLLGFLSLLRSRLLLLALSGALVGGAVAAGILIGLDWPRVSIHNMQLTWFALGALLGGTMFMTFSSRADTDYLRTWWGHRSSRKEVVS